MDRFLKLLAAARFQDKELILIPGSLNFEFFANEGIAFSIPFSGPLLWALSLTLIMAFSVFGLKYGSRQRPLLLLAYLSFVLGALSNLYDRVLMGYTVDYLMLFGRSAVNIADAMIVCGAIALIWGTKKRLKAPPARQESP